jgi:hypothetical protein
MTLSTKTLNLLADTLAPKIAEQVMLSDEFVELMHTIVPAMIDTEVGEMEEDLHFDLSLMVMERLAVRAM